MKKGILFLTIVYLLSFGFSGCYKPPEYAPPPGYTGNVEDLLPARPDPSECGPGGAYDPFGRYAETVTLNVVAINHPLEENVKPGTTPKNQTFNALCEEVLNVRLNYIIDSQPDNYEQKLSLSIASKKVPDLFYVTSSTTVTDLYKSGLLADLGSSFWRFLPEIQNMYLKDVPDILPTVIENKKLFAVPVIANKFEMAQKLYVRRDWLESVGMNAPTTVEEMISVGKAFVDHKLGGERTTGLAAHKDLMWEGSFNLMGLFNAFDSAPNAFLKGADGKLYDGTVAPETGLLLASLAVTVAMTSPPTVCDVRSRLSSEVSLLTGPATNEAFLVSDSCWES